MERPHPGNTPKTWFQVRALITLVYERDINYLVFINFFDRIYFFLAHPQNQFCFVNPTRTSYPAQLSFWDQSGMWTSDKMVIHKENIIYTHPSSVLTFPDSGSGGLLENIPPFRQTAGVLSLFDSILFHSILFYAWSHSSSFWIIVYKTYGREHYLLPHSQSQFELQQLFFIMSWTK